MRLSILLLLISFACRVHGQNPQDEQLPVPKPGPQLNAPTENYDKETIEIKLARARKLVVAGTILIPAAVVVETVGIGMIIGGVVVNSNFGELLGGIGLTVLGPMLLPPGIVCLAVGLRMKKKWTGIERNMYLHSGILPDGRVGLALNF